MQNKKLEAYTLENYNQTVHVHENHKITVDGVEKFVPAWWLRKNQFLGIVDDVKRETEKALQVFGVWGYGFEGPNDGMRAWLPKSILIDRAEKEEQERREDIHYYNNMIYTNYLNDLAKKNGVKLGRAKCWDKVQAKLASSHVEYMSRKEFGL